MESRFIRNGQITASSRYSGYPPWDGKLNSDGYWATATQEPPNQQWIQVDFLDRTTKGNDVIITGIQMQGSGYQIFPTDCWVKSLQIQSGNTVDGMEFIYEDGTRVSKVTLF